MSTVEVSQFEFSPELYAMHIPLLIHVCAYDLRRLATGNTPVLILEKPGPLLRFHGVGKWRFVGIYWLDEPMASKQVPSVGAPVDSRILVGDLPPVHNHLIVDRP